MKKLLCVLMCVGMVSMAQAIDVVNSSFEETGGLYKIVGFDQADGAYQAWTTNPAEVPGWETLGAVADSGVEGNGGSVGTYGAFLMTSDSAVFQVTGHTIALGESYTLKADVKEIWNSLDVDFAFYYTSDGGVTLNPLVTQTMAVNQDYAWHEFTLNHTVVDAAAVGGNLVILFDDTVGSNGWVAIDNVRLVPEPATLSMLGLGALAFLKRRKA